MSSGGSPPIDRDEAIGEALRRLELAARTWRMYPPSSPVVDQAVHRLHAALGAALRGRELELEIRPREVCWQGNDGSVHSAELPELATRLHRHRIARLRFAAQHNVSAIEALVAAVARDEAPGVPSPLCQGRVAGIDADSLELDGLLRGGGEAIDDVWSHVLARFDETSSTAPDWESVAQHSDTARDFLRWALDPAEQPEEMALHSRSDGFALLCEQIAGHVSQIDDAVQKLADASVGMFEDLDPETWMELLTDPIPLGSIEDDETIDLTRQIAHALSTNQILQLVHYAVQSRSRATPRLYKFLSRVVGGRSDRQTIAEHVAVEVEGNDSEFARSWPQLLEVLTSENPDKWAGLDYRAAVNRDQVETAVSPWNVVKFRPRFGEMEPEFLSARKARLAHGMLQRELDEANYVALAGAIGDGIPSVVGQGDFLFLEELVATLSRHAADAHRSDVLRAAVREALATLEHPDVSAALARGLATCDDALFHALWRVIEHLGTRLLPELLEVMAETRSPSYRHHLLRIVAGMSEIPLEPLRAALEDQRLPLVRDLVWILVALDRPPLAPLVRFAARHKDPTVRREAMPGLASCPDEESELILLEALSDTALEVRVAALRAFRQRFAADSAARLMTYLQLPNRDGRNSHLIAAAAKALGRIGDERALPELARLDQWVLFFPRRRRVARAAAVRAMSEIRRRAAADGRSRSSEDDGVVVGRIRHAA